MTELLNRPKHRKGISLSLNPKPSKHYQNSIFNPSSSIISKQNQGQYHIFIPFSSIPPVYNTHKTVLKKSQVNPIVFNQSSPQSTLRLNSSVFVYEAGHNSYRQIQRQNKYYSQKNRDLQSNIHLERSTLKQKQTNIIQKEKFQQSCKQYTFQQVSQSESPKKKQKQQNKPFIQHNNSKGLMSNSQKRQNYHLNQERTYNDRITNQDHKQNIKMKKQQRQLDINKIQLIESKLLDIIRICQHGL